MSTEFFQTIMGKKFYEADVPRALKALERIADALDRIEDVLDDVGTRVVEALEPESIPEQRLGDSLCCDDPDCPDKDGKIREQHQREMADEAARTPGEPTQNTFKCMTCNVRWNTEPVMVPVSAGIQIGLCSLCAEAVKEFQKLVNRAEGEAPGGLLERR